MAVQRAPPWLFNKHVLLQWQHVVSADDTYIKLLPCCHSWFDKTQEISIRSTQRHIKLQLKFQKITFFTKKWKFITKPTCLIQSSRNFLGYMLIKKGIFSVNHGEIAFGIKKILRVAQRTHTSNVPGSPLLFLLRECIIVDIYAARKFNRIIMIRHIWNLKI